MPVAGNFDGNAANGDEVGLFDGTKWYLDTNHDYKVDTVVDQPAARIPDRRRFRRRRHESIWRPIRRIPSISSSSIWRRTVMGKWTPPSTPPASSGSSAFVTRPVAADMDSDGTTDVGLWVPDRSGATGDQHRRMVLPALQFRRRRPPGTVNTLNHQFSPTPLGHDVFARLGNQYAMPIVGNFDPPVGSTNDGPTISQVVVSQTKGKMSWNAADPDGVASYVAGHRRERRVERRRPVHGGSSGVNFSAPLGIADLRRPHLHDHGDRQGRPFIDRHGDLHRDAPRAPARRSARSWCRNRRARSVGTLSIPTAWRVRRSRSTEIPCLNVAGPYAAASGVNFSGADRHVDHRRPHLHDHRDRQGRPFVDRQRNLHHHRHGVDRARRSARWPWRRRRAR